MLTFIILAPLFLIGQQEPQFTQNMFNLMGVNPGYAGMNNAICVTGIARQQWVGFKDAEGNRVNPETYLLSADATVRALRGGIGLTILQDQIGFYTINDIELGYAYHRQSKTGRLGIGAQIKFINTTLDAGKFLAVDETDPILSNLGGGEASNMMIDMNLGLFYKFNNDYYIGFSSTRLLESSKEFDNATNAYVNLRRHYYFTTGLNFNLDEDGKFELLPSVFIKSDGASFQFDINSLLMVNRKFWGGLTYRYQDAVGLIVGVMLNELKVGYSYDIPMSAVGAGGSHEIMINYCFKIELEQFRKSFRNTRYL